MVKPLHVVPVTLTGRWVRLEPLGESHAAGFFAAGGQDEEIWRHMTVGPMRSEEERLQYIRSALHHQFQGEGVPFCVMNIASGRPVGSPDT